jgi:hypothetical protein
MVSKISDYATMRNTKETRQSSSGEKKLSKKVRKEINKRGKPKKSFMA